VVATLTARHVQFTEVSAHRATLEEAYMELTRDAVEFHSAQQPGAQQDGAQQDGARPGADRAGASS
jgi:ABC-2 type transport system ATP-binding protein